MGWTKREFITAAFEELGLGTYAFDLAPDQAISAGRRLDAMMAEWNGKGIRLGYPLSIPTEVDLDDQTSVPDWSNQAVICSLACVLAPSIGRTPMPSTVATAKKSYNTLLARASLPPQMQLPSMPAGAGNKTWRSTQNPFLPAPEDQIEAGGDGFLSFD